MFDEIILINLADNQGDANLRELARSLYSPFKPYVSKYGEYESALLLQDLVNNTQTSKDLIDELRNVSQSVNKVVTSFGNASKRCCDLTEGKIIRCILSKVDIKLVF